MLGLDIWLGRVCVMSGYLVMWDSMCDAMFKSVLSLSLCSSRNTLSYDIFTGNPLYLYLYPYGSVLLIAIAMYLVLKLPV